MNRYRQNTRAPFTVLGAEATVVTPHDSRLHLLNPVATRVWELCDGDGRTIPEIVDALLDEFDVDRATAEQETTAFLDDALARGLVQREAGE